MRKTTYLKEFNAEELQNLYDQMTKKIAGISGKEVVAFVGMTGSGKSTTVNFFLDRQMERFSDGLSTLFKVKEGDDQKVAVIGHGGSQTLFPESFDVKHPSLSNSSLALLDTAGLGDTRGKNVSLCVSLALKHISEVTKIKGLVIVIRESMISDTRARGIDEFFKLVTDLSSQLNSRNVAFCITGLSNTGDINEDDVKQRIIDKVAQNSQIMLEELDENDSDEIKNKVQQTVRILQLMKADSMFLMRDLDNPTIQKSLRDTFYSYINKMPGLNNGLRLAIPEATELKLANWSTDLAKKANDQLSRFSELKKNLSETTTLLNKLNSLSSDLDETGSLLNDASLHFEEISNREAEIQREIQSTNARLNDTIVNTKEFSIPLPRQGSNITGLISFERKFQTFPNFESITPHPGVTIKSINQREGTFVVSYTGSPDKNSSKSSINIGFDVSYQQKHLPSYQQHIRALSDELDKISSFKKEVSEHAKEHSKKLEQIKRTLLPLTKELSINLNTEATVSTLLTELSAQEDILSAKISRLESELSVLKSQINASNTQYQFLHQLAKQAELIKLPEINRFIKLYSQCEFFSGANASQPSALTTHGIFRNYTSSNSHQLHQEKGEEFQQTATLG